MFFFITFIIICLLVVYGIYNVFWLDDWTAETTFGKVVGSFIFGCCGLFLAFGLGTVTVMSTQTLIDEVPDGAQSWDLQQINMGSKIHGTFFIGTGYIDGDLVYNFYTKSADGGFDVGQVYAKNSHIIETNTAAPHIVEQDWRASHWVSPSWPHWLSEMTPTYTIYVPVGSVSNNVNMDLPNS